MKSRGRRQEVTSHLRLHVIRPLARRPWLISTEHALAMARAPTEKVEIVTRAEPPDGPISVEPKLDEHLGAKVSVSLRYFQKSPECFSEWAKNDLKGFTKIIELLRQQTSNQVKSRGKNGSPACRSHSGDVKTKGFERPSEISQDIAFHELYATNKARLHGFFIGEVFFLVWLDRNHRAFP